MRIRVVGARLDSVCYLSYMALMRTVLIGLMTTVLFSCKKDEPTEVTNDGSISCGSVQGIQRRDMNGMLMFPYDSTDWRVTDDWCPNVEQLFQDRPTVTFSTSLPDSLLPICFPNPCSEIFLLGFYRNDTSYVDIRFVNTDFQLLWGVDSLTDLQLAVHADTLGITAPQIVRAYYRVVHSDGTAHRGHGDVQLNL